MTASGSPTVPALPALARTTALTDFAAPPSSPKWLEGWRHYEGPPPVEASAIRSSLTSFQSTLTPATLQEIGANLLLLTEMFGEPKNWTGKLPLYFEALADLPIDLLCAGVMSCIRHGQFFPKPAEIREPVRDELARRSLARSRLQFALAIAERHERKERK